MFKRPATSSPKTAHRRFESVENYSPCSFKLTHSISLQTEPIGTCSKSTNTPNYLDEMLTQGQKMTDEQFEAFIKVRASDCYWKILAERARLKLDDQLRENRQLHQLLDELNQENEHLQAKSEHCQYLTNVFNSITSEYDSGIELPVNDESPWNKRQKTHF